MTAALRAEIVAIAVRLADAGLNVGTAGNVSARVPGGFLVTPSGLPIAETTPADVVELDLDGRVVTGDRVPSSEWRLHRDLYVTRPETGAIVHAHPPFCTTLAVLRREIPAVHYMIALAGGATIRCAEYATFGTPDLAARAATALAGRRACLLANHGMVALGATLDDAHRLAVEVEALAALYWRALQAGEPVILDDEEIARVAGRFATHGQRPRRAGGG